MGEWIEWKGQGYCPVVHGTHTEVKIRDGGVGDDKFPELWIGWDWCDEEDDSDIVAYRVLTEACASSSVKSESATIVSDGGSSSYYTFTISNKAGESIVVETGDVIRCMVGDNFSLGNVVKACRRMWEESQGRGKAGGSLDYDANKNDYFSKEFSYWYGKEKQ